MGNVYLGSVQITQNATGEIPELQMSLPTLAQFGETAGTFYTEASLEAMIPTRTLVKT